MVNSSLYIRPLLHIRPTLVSPGHTAEQKEETEQYSSSGVGQEVISALMTLVGGKISRGTKTWSGPLLARFSLFLALTGGKVGVQYLRSTVQSHYALSQ